MPFLELMVVASAVAVNKGGGGSDEDNIKWGLACTTSPTVLEVSVIEATYKIDVDDDDNDEDAGEVRDCDCDLLFGGIGIRGG